jgi:hypothetical protein
MDSVFLTFKTLEVDASLRSSCEQALKHFTLPPYTLLCFFDDDNPPALVEEIGIFYCGVHAVVSDCGLSWPPYVRKLFRDGSGLERWPAFRNVIYINGRTCCSTVGTVITLAHELQHFVQYGFFRKLWFANTMIYSILRDGPPTPIRPWDIPYERDTTTVSKQVATKIHGEQIVQGYAEAQIAAGIDPDKWESFLKLPHRTPFNLLDETKLWVEKYQFELEMMEQTEIDFTQDEWWR